MFTKRKIKGIFIRWLISLVITIVGVLFVGLTGYAGKFGTVPTMTLGEIISILPNAPLKFYIYILLSSLIITIVLPIYKE